MPTLPIGEVTVPSPVACNSPRQWPQCLVTILKRDRCVVGGISLQNLPKIGTRDSNWTSVRAEKQARYVTRGSAGTQSKPLESPAGHPEGPPVKHGGSAYVDLVNGLDNLCEEGQLDKALDVLLLMDQQGTVPSKGTYKSLLKACSKRKTLAYAKRVHAHLAQYRLDSDWSLGQCLVSALATCGGLDDARKVLERLPHRTASSWTAMISGYGMAGNGQEALSMYRSMRKEGLTPNKYTLISLLKTCGLLQNLEEGKGIHAEALKYGHGNDLFVGTCVVDMYAKCGSIANAQKVFDNLPQRDSVSWNVMLAAYAQQGQREYALQLYSQMREEGATPDDRTFVSVIQTCGMLADKEDSVILDERSIKPGCVQKVKALHFDAWRMGYSTDVFVGNTLISVYGKCGSVIDAQNVFDDLPHCDDISCTALLSAYIQQGEAEQALHFYEVMLEEGVSVDNRTVVNIVQACGMLAVKDEGGTVDGCFTEVNCLEIGKAVHADVLRKGYQSDVFVSSALISMYGKCGSIVDARLVFEGCPQHDVVLWNAMQTAYIEQGDSTEALQLYEHMWIEGLSPRDRTFLNALRACGMLAGEEEGVVVDGLVIKVKALAQGKAIQAKAWENGYSSDIFIASALIIMYGKCNSMRDVKAVFDFLPCYDVATWSAMLAVYVEDAQAEQCLQVYAQMKEDSILPTCRTFVLALQACSILAEKEADIVLNGQSIKLKSLERCRAIHADIKKMGYESDCLVANTLTSVYGKCGNVVDAWDVFNRLSPRDVVSWTAMLAAFAHQGQGEKALQLYKEMCEEAISPNEFTIVCVLQVCGDTGRSDVCKDVHDMLVSTRNCVDPLLTNSLIHAYARCASMVDAEIMFRTIPEPDVVAWTTLIAGYARQGNCAASMLCYEEMQLKGVKPDRVTFLSLMSACSHAGQVDRGVEYLDSMSRDHGINPEIEHYVAIVDLLGRAGYFTKVEELIREMPMQPNLSLWLCLLSACQKHGKVSLGKQAFDYVVGVRPQHSAAYMLMSNIYQDAGLWDHAKRVMDLRQKAGAWKKPGQTWIGRGQELHTFMVRDSKHPQQERLYNMLRRVGLELGERAELPG